MSQPIGKPTWEMNRISRPVESGSTGTVFPLILSEHETLHGPMHEATNSHNNVFGPYAMPKPVCVEKTDIHEWLVYRAFEMRPGELYPVRWKGEDYALKKTERGVVIFKFFPL